MKKTSLNICFSSRSFVLTDAELYDIIPDAPNLKTLMKKVN